MNAVCKTSRKGEVDGIKCDDYNMNLYKSLIKDRREMVLDITHQVFVISKSGSRAKKGEVKHISRCVHLIDAAMQFCVDYTLLCAENSTTKEILQMYLCGHEQALRSIYCVAYGPDHYRGVHGPAYKRRSG